MRKMWNKGRRQGPRSMGPPFARGGRGGGGGGGPLGPYSMGNGTHFHGPMNHHHHHRLPSPSFEYGCGPPLPPPPPPPPSRFNPYGGPRYENGPPGHFGGPPGLPRGPLLPSPSFVPMEGPPMNFPKRGFKRKRGSGGSFRGRNGSRNKIAKTEKENPEFFCDTCDRGFDTEASLTEHRQSHKKCDVDGCSFEAHSKIVELHVKMQHETGFAERIMQLSSTEEIEKWKNERKKNFPSSENVAKRQAEQAEKLARGELLKTKEFGRMNRRGGSGFRGRGGRGGFRGGRGTGRGPPNGEGAPNGNYLQPLIDPGYISFEDAPVALAPPPHPDNPRSFHGKPMGRGRGRQFKGKGRFGRSFRGRGRGRGNGNRKGGVRKFGGTKAPVGGDQSEPESESKTETKLETETFSDGLITDSEAEMALGMSNGGVNTEHNGVSLPDIVANGADNAESDSDAPLELPSKVRVKPERKPEVVEATPKLVLPGALASLVAAYESEVEEIVKESQSKNTTSQIERKRIQPLRVQHQFKQTQLTDDRPKPTLLEMLLAKEIRHERNVILQCVRYIVQNDFFEQVVPPSEPMDNAEGK